MYVIWEIFRLLIGGKKNISRVEDDFHPEDGGGRFL